MTNQSDMWLVLCGHNVTVTLHHIVPKQLHPHLTHLQMMTNKYAQCPPSLIFRWWPAARVICESSHDITSIRAQKAPPSLIFGWWPTNVVIPLVIQAYRVAIYGWWQSNGQIGRSTYRLTWSTYFDVSWCLSFTKNLSSGDDKEMWSNSSLDPPACGNIQLQQWVCQFQLPSLVMTIMWGEEGSPVPHCCLLPLCYLSCAVISKV